MWCEKDGELGTEGKSLLRGDGVRWNGVGLGWGGGRGGIESREGG